MALNRFNQYTTEGDTNVTNGSLDIFGYTLRADNLNASQPLKTNSIKQLISSKLDISDINNLQTELNATIQTPYNDGDIVITAGNIVSQDVVTDDIASLNAFKSGIEMSIDDLQVGKVQKTGDTMTGNLTAPDVVIDNAPSLNTFVANTESSLSDLSTQKVAKSGDTMTGNLTMSNNNITGVNEIQTQSISNTAGTILIKPTGGQALFQKPGGGTIEFGLEDSGSQFNFKKNGATNELCSEGTDIIQFTTDCFGAVKIASLNPTTDAFQLRDYDLDMNSNEIQNVNLLKVDNIQSKNLVDDIVCGSNLDMFTKDVDNIGSMTITSTRYLSKVADFGTPSGDLYIIPANTTWIILGQITLEYGIGFSANSSLRGIDFSATITFDETTRDCVIKATSENMYISNLTIVGGGGRFTGDTTLVPGLLDAQNFNTLAPAPFYGRDKRFKVSDCNILRPFKIGRVIGYGTLNITNNFFNGGGGLAGQAADYYTNEGLSVSGGLSLEFNNNKMVLMAGAQQVSTAKLLNMDARINPVLGFNAVTITGNVFHPRSTETGIDFDPDSRTELGNISGNVFIRTGGTSPLINYTDQTVYDNYNPLSIENYSINANSGVVDSEPNLKSAIGNSNSVTDINPTRSEIVPTFNDQVLQINSSARFAVQVDMSGGTQAFVANERMSDVAGRNFLILAVEAPVGVSPNITQTVYVTDMSATPQQIPNPPGGWTSPSGGSFTTATFTYRYRYCEKDPRKLVTVGTFTISTGNNETFFVAPGNGTPDTECEVEGTATNLGAGGTVSISCTRLFTEGAILTFYLSSASGSATSITKGIINVK